MDENKVIGISQHGLMRGKLYLTWLAVLHSEDMMDKRVAVNVFYLRFSKVFDSVFYNIIYQKVEKVQVT